MLHRHVSLLNNSNLSTSLSLTECIFAKTATVHFKFRLLIDTQEY